MRDGSRVRNVALALTALLVAPGCRHLKKTPVEVGAGIFQRTCAPCHGPDARGTHPPGFTIAPRNLTDPALQDRLSDAQIRDTIRYGKGQMPPFGMLFGDDDVNALAAYVRSVRKPPLAQVAPATSTANSTTK